MVDEWKKDTSELLCVAVGVDMNVDTSVFNYIFRDCQSRAARYHRVETVVMRFA
jgi:hypothetical protein